MKKSKPTKLLLGFLGIATFASLVGTVSGTLAWYAYSTRATLSYSGTSVNNTVQLQIGIASQNKIPSIQSIEDILAHDDELSSDEKQNIRDMFEVFWDNMQENKWDDDSYFYYFAPYGVGLSSPIINTYLYCNGYATNFLAPVTSGGYVRGSDFVLKKAPNSSDTNHSSLAEKSSYAKIPFAFRVLRSNTTILNSFVEGSELWLTDAQVRASSIDDGNVYRAIRMFVDRNDDYENDFILNPSALNNGKTVVGGLLDLGCDTFYDYDEDNNEIIYGDYEIIGGIQSSYSGPDEIADINNTGRTGEDYDTFTAKHRQGINYYENYNDCIFKTAEYESLSSIAPLKDEVTGVLHNRDAAHPTSVCKTAGAEGHYLGRVDFTIYLEGWDHSVIDEELEHCFDLGLTFEINKLGA